MELDSCPICKKKVNGFLSTRYFISNSVVDFLNEYTHINASACCNDCGFPLIRDLIRKFDNEKKDLLNEIENKFSAIPIITLNNPNDWEYEILEMVSSQSVIGTGFLSEVSSSWSDMFGTESNALNDKIKTGEDRCKDKIRLKCVLLGGNAIIATDIDYSEVGGTKGMMMVCMAGTAVKVKNWGQNYLSKKDDLNMIAEKTLKLLKLQEIPYPDLGP